MRRLSTLHIDSERNWGGGQRQVAGLCLYLRDQGHGVKIVCRPGSKLESWAHENDIEHISVDMSSPLAVLKLRSAIKREAPDIVHLHASRAHTLGSVAARLAGAKVVIATRRMDDPINMVWPNTSAYGKWATAIVAISNSVRDVLVQCGVDPAKIHIIRSGTDMARFTSAVPDPELRTRLGIDDSLPIVCTAATLGERKGISYLIEAAAILNQKGTPLHLIIAGDGNHRAELEALAATSGVNASFIGFCGDMPTLLASIDIFVMPSLSEGLGIAVLEAMAAGKPVIASAVGGLRESVVDGETGFQVPPADSQALAAAIDKILANSDLTARFSSAGQARARSEFSLDNMAKKNEALYFELLDR